MPDDRYTDILDAPLDEGGHDLHTDQWQWWVEKWAPFNDQLILIGKYVSLGICALVLFLTFAKGFLAVIYAVVAFLGTVVMLYTITTVVLGIVYFSAYVVDALINRRKYIAVSRAVYKTTLWLGGAVIVVTPIYLLYILYKIVSLSEVMTNMFMDQ